MALCKSDQHGFFLIEQSTEKAQDHKPKIMDSNQINTVENTHDIYIYMEITIYLVY